jgi:hypothetical protein
MRTAGHMARRSSSVASWLVVYWKLARHCLAALPVPSVTRICRKTPPPAFAGPAPVQLVAAGPTVHDKTTEVVFELSTWITSTVVFPVPPGAALATADRLEIVRPPDGVGP